MVICIEGIDASGKATQSRILAERLLAALFSFPDYGTPAGRTIFHNLKTTWGCFPARHAYGTVEAAGFLDDKVNALVLQSLMATNRLERGKDLLQAAQRGHVVLDRYDASAIVYGGLDGLDPEWVREVNAQLPLRPNLYLLLDVPVEEGFRRRPERRDRYEQDRAYLERVREGYLRLFAEQQQRLFAAEDAMSFDEAVKSKLPRWVTIDGQGTIEEVQERIWRACVVAGV